MQLQLESVVEQDPAHRYCPDAVGRFIGLVAGPLSRIGRCRVALEEIRLVSSFDARVTYNAYACFLLLPRHQWRHLDQAEHVWR